jgi:hypothetical protein
MSQVSGSQAILERQCVAVQPEPNTSPASIKARDFADGSNSTRSGI